MNSDKPKQAREWWINLHASYEKGFYSENPSEWLPSTEGQIVHVIEYSALEEEKASHAKNMYEAGLRYGEAIKERDEARAHNVDVAVDYAFMKKERDEACYDRDEALALVARRERELDEYMAHVEKLRAERDEARAEIERLKSVGNPTMWAYEQVCKSNDRKRELLTLAEEALESLVNNYVSEWCSVTAAAALAKIRQAKG